jgi:hypothetical protein
MGKHKEPTANMKTVLIDLLNVVYEYDDGKAGLPHDVIGIHHMTLKAMAKPDYGKLILLDVSYAADSPAKVIWTVAITAYGLRAAKKLSKVKEVINDTPINATAKKQRSLRTINWQINVNQKEGRQIYEDAKAMKADPKQSFTRTMNQLMELHKELKAGQVGLLQRLYPDAYATMLLIARNEIELGYESRIGHLLDEFKGYMGNAPRSAVNGATQGATLGLRAMSYDDDNDTVELDIRKDTQSGLIATKNFLSSMERLNGVKLQSNEPQGIKKLTVPQFEVNFGDD